MWGCLCLLNNDLVDSNLGLRCGLLLVGTGNYEGAPLSSDVIISCLRTGLSVFLSKREKIRYSFEITDKFSRGLPFFGGEWLLCCNNKPGAAFGAFTEFCSIEGPVRRLSVSFGSNEFESWKKQFSYISYSAPFERRVVDKILFAIELSTHSVTRSQFLSLLKLFAPQDHHQGSHRMNPLLESHWLLRQTIVSCSNCV